MAAVAYDNSFGAVLGGVIKRCNDVTSWGNFVEILGMWVSIWGLFWEDYDGGGDWGGCY